MPESARMGDNGVRLHHVYNFTNGSVFSHLIQSGKNVRQGTAR